LDANKNIFSAGVSAEALHSLMAKFASLGTHYRQLQKFCSHHADRPRSGPSGGALLKAFIDALKEILQSYWFAVFSAGGKNSGISRTLRDIEICSNIIIGYTDCLYVCT